MKIIVISIVILILIIFVVNWLSRSQIGTLTLFHATIKKRRQLGDTPEAACLYALSRISHRKPINELTEKESARIAQVFSRFEVSQDVDVLLRDALLSGKVEILREPYISNLERLGLEKGKAK